MKYCSTCRVVYPSDMNSCPSDSSVLSTTSELVQGLIVRGKYEILEKIGSGGMASVYRARHLAFDEIRAIKVVRQWHAEDDDFIRRLRSEAVIARRLKHPNAVHVDDLDQLEDGRPFIVMEYIEGTDLRKLIREKGPLPWRRALDITRQVASALGAAHKLGIVHRDIKPDNIVLLQNGEGENHVKVLDFGIAKLCGQTATAGTFQTRSGVVLCTPEYASPEQARGATTEQLDGRSDLYSLGVVLFEMLTGSLPFHSDTPMGLLLAQISTAPRRPSEVKPDIDLPPAVSALLMKSLEKNPAERFQDAGEMLQAIADAQNGVATVSADGSHVSQANEATPPEGDSSAAMELLKELEDGRGSRRGRLYAVAGVVVVAAILTGWWWGRTRQSDIRAKAVSARVDKVIGQSPWAAHVHATVTDGVVVLSGEADGDAAIDDLSTKLAQLDGVYRVDRQNVRVVHATSNPRPTAAVKSTVTNTRATDNTPVLSVPGATAPTPGLASDATSSIVAVDDTTSAQSARAQKMQDARIADYLARANKAHDEGAYDDEISSYDFVLKLDPKNIAARKGKRRAIQAKQADPAAGVDQP